MVDFPAAGSGSTSYLPAARGSLFRPGDPLTFTAYTGNVFNIPNGYTIRDIRGNVVGSGTLSGVQSSFGGSTVPPFTLSTDTTGWPYGWYRIFFTNSAMNDPISGNSAGGHNFGLVPARVNLPANPAQGTALSQPQYEDVVFRGVCGVGPARYTIWDAGNYAGDLADLQTLISLDDQYWNNPAYADPARPRPRFVQFPYGGFDFYRLPTESAAVYLKDETIDGSKVFIGSGPGTSTGAKITVHYPNASTVAETYDNITSEAQLVAAAADSAYVKVIARHGVAPSASVVAPVAIGRSRRDGTAAVVADLYPRGVEWFEGPRNEPNVEDMSVEETVHALRLFRAYVKAGNPSAKVLGPCFSTYGSASQGSLYDQFLALGGGAYLDGISWHCYDAFGANFDVAPGRENLSRLVGLLTKYGVQNLPRWQTEHGTYISSSGLFNAALSRGATIQALVQEQFGVPKERNHYWYTYSHGFWGQDTWLLEGRQSITPMGLLFRTLGEAIFGKQYVSALDFGSVGNTIFVGSLYRNPTTGAQTIALQATSPLLDDRVTFTLTGASGPLAVTDAWGNTSSVTPVSGRLTLNVTDFAKYLDLPAGATISVYSHGTWPPIANPLNGIDRAMYPTNATTATGTGGAGAIRAIDDRRRYMRPEVPELQGPVYQDPGNPEASPVTIRVDFANGVRCDRVLVRSGQPWFGTSGLVDFDVQTLNPDGSTWTTRATWMFLPYSQFVKHPVGYTEDGMTWHEYWGAPYIHDCPFADGAVQTKAIRLYVRRASYLKTADPTIHAEGGSFSTQQWVNLSRISVFCDEIALLDRRVVSGQVDLA